MSHVLITGGAGFIGLNLARRFLAEGTKITRLTLVDNFARGQQDRELRDVLADPRVRLVTVDLLDSKAVQAIEGEFDYLLHFAAILGVENVLNRPYKVLEENMLVTNNVIKLAQRQSALKKLCFASTSEVYAGTLTHFSLKFPTPESTPLAVSDLAHPRTSYMLSKIYGEALIQQSGLPFVIMRPHNVYGPRMGMSHVIPQLMSKMREAPKGGTVPIASSDHRRAFCYVEDAVEIIVRATLSENAKNVTLNVGNEREEYSIAELAEKIAACVGRTDLKLQPSEPTPGSPQRRVPDMTLTETHTGHKSKVSIAEGLERTHRWYAENIFSGRKEPAK